MRHEHHRIAVAAPAPAVQQSQVGDLLEREVLVHERVELGEELAEAVEVGEAAMLELRGDGGQLHHAREALGRARSHGHGVWHCSTLGDPAGGGSHGLLTSDAPGATVES